MTEDDRVTALVEDVLARARVPSHREREDLRRELLAHFDDAVHAHGSIDAALAEFGLVDEVGSRFRIVYRAQRLLAHTLRISAGLTVSLVVALGIELAASRPGAFRAMAGLGSLIVLMLVLWRELVGRRLRRPNVVARAGRWLVVFLAFAAWEYGVHHYAGVPFGVLRAATTGAVLVAVAAATAIIMACADRAFSTVVQTREV